MKPEIVLLGILPDNLERISQELFRGMLTATRVIFAMKWKTLNNREMARKPAEYVTMVKLTSYVNKRPLQEYQQK